MSLSNTLKELRKARGYTLLDIAKKMNVSEATVQRWESGNIKNMKYDNIVKLARLLNVHPAALMGWQEDTPQEVHTIAAHHDGLDWTEEELDEIEEFKRYVLSKRKNNT
ncbi:helix-turn-helix domain-containing protein [Ihubacter sp. rT4E-8]|uniref:helix-turn-helix domain-containing protein n=1 Tax=Ihubacter sp. rT4E-8 TaxID=3242369 RepID=UPI003CF7135B